MTRAEIDAKNSAFKSERMDEMRDTISELEDEITELKTLLAKKQKEAEEDAVGFLYWVNSNEYKCAGAKWWDKNVENLLDPAELFAKYKSETK